MPGTWSDRAPLTGIVAVVLVILAFVIGGETPDFDATGKEVLNFYADNEGSQFAASILLAYGALFLIFFAGALRSVLRRSEPGTGGLSAVSFGGGVLMALGMLVFAGLGFTLADGHDKFEPATAQTLNALNGDFFLPLAVGTSALMLGAGIAILRGGALPRWLGWAAVVIGVLAVTPVGFFAFLASGLWIIVASVLLLRSPAAPTSAATPASPGAP
jgi:hypothetical protein